MEARQVKLAKQVSASSSSSTVRTLNFDKNFLLRTRDFVILIEDNKKLCKVHQQMLASASPCAAHNGTRPLLGVVNICPGKRWKTFNAGVDLFRHELLHTLKEARKHLGCPTLAGVETDSAEKIHLNEYIYGNELMTPNLSNVSNRFSYISAAILEETFLGDKPWYRVNRSAIRWEHEALWYGREWGCTFAEHSCFDFIAERIRRRKSTFPFCSEDDYYAGATKLRLKYFGSNVRVRRAKCWSQALTSKEIADNGVMAYSLLDTFLEKKHIGSPSKWRFCPMTKIFVEDRFDLPLGTTLL